jgi:hypothetical protein
VYVSTLAHSLGYLEELSGHGLVELHADGEAGVEAALALAADPGAAQAQRRRRDAFVAGRVDVVRFVSRAVEAVATGARAEKLRELHAHLAGGASGSPSPV